jgi:hypothetical protein
VRAPSALEPTADMTTPPRRNYGPLVRETDPSLAVLSLIAAKCPIRGRVTSMVEGLRMLSIATATARGLVRE